MGSDNRQTCHADDALVADRVGEPSGSADSSERRAERHTGAATMLGMKPSATSLRAGRPAVVVVYVSLVGPRDSHHDGGEERVRNQ